jgi:hypothetical protein
MDQIYYDSHSSQPKVSRVSSKLSFGDDESLSRVSAINKDLRDKIKTQQSQMTKISSQENF